MRNKKFTLMTTSGIYKEGEVFKYLGEKKYFIVLKIVNHTEMKCKYISRFRFWFICFKNWIKKKLKMA